LAGEGEDGDGVGCGAGVVEVGTVFLEGEGSVVEDLVCKDGLVEQGGSVVGLLAVGGVEEAEGVAGSAAERLGDAEVIECFGGEGGGGVEVESALQAAIGGIELACAELSGAEAGPALGVFGAVGGVAGEFVDRAGQVVLLDEEASPVETGLDEVEVEGEGVLVGLGGFGRASGTVEGEAEVVPGLGGGRGVGGEEADGMAEGFDGFGGSIGPDEAVAFEEGLTSGGIAAGD
jgi:hypothetical protein